jgi:hypothetical protein
VTTAVEERLPVTLSVVGDILDPYAPDHGASRDPLGWMLDVLASRCGGWVLLTDHGDLIAHGIATDSPQPPHAVVEAVLHKRSVALRTSTTWLHRTREGLARGLLDEMPVSLVDVRPGAALWVVGGRQHDLLVEARGAVAGRLAESLAAPVHDSALAALLVPAGPVSACRAAQVPSVAVGVILPMGSGSSATVAGAARAALLDDGIRVHHDRDHERVVLADADGERLTDVLADLAARVAGHAGISRTRLGDRDYVAAAARAATAAEIARAEDRPLSDAGSPKTSARLTLRRAVAAAGNEVDPREPLQLLLNSADPRSSEMVATLRQWCRSGFNAPVAADALYLHVNTVRYRLRQFEAITSVDLSCVEQRLALALRLWGDEA